MVIFWVDMSRYIFTKLRPPITSCLRTNVARCMHYILHHCSPACHKTRTRSNPRLHQGSTATLHQHWHLPIRTIAQYLHILIKQISSFSWLRPDSPETSSSSHISRWDQLWISVLCECSYLTRALPTLHLPSWQCSLIPFKRQLGAQLTPSHCS